ncbi:helix-turn-helix domain-containing protein [Fodinicola acaciae]|uniref:helix-turn-helix domain-containing protein n=1 Tax=Fodinicola acaciae TaxID=2681555 RepID=UPI001FE958CB|nr:helix-turn-helix domain-containing protein [Fodinicola acaciae]
MSVVRACQVTLTGSVRRLLKQRVRGQKTPYRDRFGAQIVLLAAAGQSNAAIASRLHTTVDTLRKWRGRFVAGGAEGLADRPGRADRGGVQVAQVRSLACELPAVTGVPLSRWSAAELAREATLRGITVQGISPATVHRWLITDAIKPWQYRSWLFPRDPDFAAKAARVLDRYAAPPASGTIDHWVPSTSSPPTRKPPSRLAADATPSLPPGKARVMRVNHEYERGEALAYLATYDVHHARVFGQCAASTGIEPFMSLVEQVMTIQPYASAKRVFWVVDNGSSHRGQAAINRLAKRFPNAVMVHTPIHAS